MPSDPPAPRVIPPPNFYLSLWAGMWAPKGTPKEVVAKLNAAVIAALASRKFARGLLISAKTSPGSSRTRWRLPKCRRPRSRNGGRSSRRPESGRNEPRLQQNGSSSVTTPTRQVRFCLRKPGRRKSGHHQADRSSRDHTYRQRRIGCQGPRLRPGNQLRSKTTSVRSTFDSSRACIIERHRRKADIG
jgi:Tripartite tricarboxylate transporter family receptor